MIPPHAVRWSYQEFVDTGLVQIDRDAALSSLSLQSDIE